MRNVFVQREALAFGKDRGASSAEKKAGRTCAAQNLPWKPSLERADGGKAHAVRAQEFCWSPFMSTSWSRRAWCGRTSAYSTSGAWSWASALRVEDRCPNSKPRGDPDPARRQLHQRAHQAIPRLGRSKRRTLPAARRPSSATDLVLSRGAAISDVSPGCSERISSQALGIEPRQ